MSRKALNPVFTDMASDGGSLPAANCQDPQLEGPEKHKLLCMIHRKFDEAFDHVRSSLPEPTEGNFRRMVAHLDSAAPGSHAPSPQRHCAQNPASSQPLTNASGEKYLSMWLQACAPGEPGDNTLDMAASPNQTKLRTIRSSHKLVIK